MLVGRRKFFIVFGLCCCHIERTLGIGCGRLLKLICLMENSATQTHHSFTPFEDFKLIFLHLLVILHFFLFFTCFFSQCCWGALVKYQAPDISPFRQRRELRTQILQLHFSAASKDEWTGDRHIYRPPSTALHSDTSLCVPVAAGGTGKLAKLWEGGNKMLAEQWGGISMEGEITEQCPVSVSLSSEAKSQQEGEKTAFSCCKEPHKTLFFNCPTTLSHTFPLLSGHSWVPRPHTEGQGVPLYQNPWPTVQNE